MEKNLDVRLTDKGVEGEQTPARTKEIISSSSSSMYSSWIVAWGEQLPRDNHYLETKVLKRGFYAIIFPILGFRMNSQKLKIDCIVRNKYKLQPIVDCKITHNTALVLFACLLF